MTAQTPGVLFVLVGPSGAGKDSVIMGLKGRFGAGDVSDRTQANAPLFVRRVITRPSSPDTEDHDTLSPEAFEAAAARGAFAMKWAAHGLSYGLPAALRDHLSAGGHAIANGARRALPLFRETFSRVVIVHLTVQPNALRARLEARGRETPVEINARIAKAAAFHVSGDDVHAIDNSGTLDTAIDAAEALIRREMAR